MYEIHAQYNWMFPLQVLFFHILSSFRRLRLYVLCGSQSRARNLPCTELRQFYYNPDGVCLLRGRNRISQVKKKLNSVFKVLISV